MEGEQQANQETPQPATVAVSADQHKALQEAHEKLATDHETFKQEVAGKFEALGQLLHLHGIRPKQDDNPADDEKAQ